MGCLLSKRRQTTRLVTCGGVLEVRQFETEMAVGQGYLGRPQKMNSMD